MTTTWRQGVLRGHLGAGHGPRPWVIKWGGSLLSRPGWPDDLRELIRGMAGPKMLVVGGGAIVEGLRQIDAASPRSPALMHRLAIEAMGLTARLVAEAVDLPVVTFPTTVSETAVLDLATWLTEGTGREILPVGWHVTSDSIAAATATTCGAGLLLAKSRPPPEGSLESLAEAGWIDGHFPAAACSLAEIYWAAAARQQTG
jgi:hypothetical protein